MRRQAQTKQLTTGIRADDEIMIIQALSDGS